MAKRFTDTEKWKDKWFRQLPAEFKLAYLYLLDQCDQAGVVELDEDLAEFQIGTAIDWGAFLDSLSGRIAKLGCGKLCLIKFISYQYGELSENCRAHNPVFHSIKKHKLERVFKGYSKGIQRGQDKDIDKDSLNKKKDEWIVPERFDCDQVRDLLDEFSQMRRDIGKPIRNPANSSKILEKFDDVPHLVHALEMCIANEWQGLKPDYRPGSNNRGGDLLTPGQRRVAASQQAMEDFINDGK